MGYRGPTNRRDFSNNIPFTPGIGDKFEMWEKLIKEVKTGRVAGPFENIPFRNFIQSPIGLVPKAGGKTRLIFHLSYDFDDDERRSVNHYIPKQLCSVMYRDLDYAVRTILKLADRSKLPIFMVKTNVVSAFRLVPLRIDQRAWLIMKAVDPESNKTFFFVEKNLPFGASLSFRIFQDFSDSLKHILEQQTGKNFQITNYLDDYMFIDVSSADCNRLVLEFFSICKSIGCPLSLEKTEWATTS